MTFKQADNAWIVFQGGPRWDGDKWIDGDKFTLSGRKKADLGVELAPGVAGLERASVEYRFDTSANVPGSVFVSDVAGGRKISASVNILGDSPAELRHNARRWDRNHRTTSPGRLWMFTSDGEPRYLPVIPSENAGQGTHEKDPNLNSGSIEWEWGWNSDEADFLGYKRHTEMTQFGSTYAVTFWNPSTAARVYPTLYLPGPGRWKVSLGFEKGDFITPMIEAGEVARINLNPRKPTFVKRRADGKIVNLWPTMQGRRPIMFLEPETRNTIAVDLVGGGVPDSPPVLSYTPKFTSWL